MAQRLTNDELAERTRTANRRRGERHRERLTIAGRAALTVWVPVGLRSRFVNEAAGLGMNINELAERYLDAGLRESKNQIIWNSAIAENSTIVESAIADPETTNQMVSPDPETADMFATPEPDPQTPVVVADTASTPPTVSVSFDRDAMMAMVDRLLADGLRGSDIARKLTAAGYRSSNGAELRGANVLREYRAWKEKSGGSDSSAV